MNIELLNDIIAYGEKVRKQEREPPVNIGTLLTTWLNKYGVKGKEYSLFFIIIDGYLYIFDKANQLKIEELISDGNLKRNKKGYLSVIIDGKQKDFHRYLKQDEVEALAKKLKCPIGDIHVHHKNGVRVKSVGKKEDTLIENVNGKYDNTLENLEVLHKDIHAMRHGDNSWELRERRLKRQRVYTS